MRERVKYILNIPVTITNLDDGKIEIKVKKSYPELSSLKGRGFQLDKNKCIFIVVEKKDYKNKINELEHLLYEIETKTFTIEQEVKKIKDNKEIKTSTEEKNG